VSQSPRLSCLSGQPAPAEVVSDWQRLLSLPERARAGLWEILGPSLGGVDAEMERRAEAFCRLYELPPSDVKASLRVGRFLLTRAAAQNLPARALAEDLVALGAADGTIAGMLVGGYEAVREGLRRSMAEEALFEHGSVLVGLDWRVDRMVASDSRAELDMPLALMTLRTREGGKDKKTTFYAVPEVIRQIREACERIERALAPPPPPATDTPRTTDKG